MTGSYTSLWPLVRLGDIGQSLIGLTYSPSNVKRTGTLVLRSSNVKDGQLVFDDNVYVNCAIPDRIRIRENDILICVRNGSRRLIGKSVLLDHRVVGQTFGAFMAVYRSDPNPFLQYFFQSYDFRRQIDEHLGATINQITNGSINGFVVALPRPDEQHEIVACLTDVDQYIENLDRLIVKKRAIKTGMMQELLTARKRLLGFHGVWPKITLREVLSFEVGYPFRSESFRDLPLGTRLIRNRDLKSNDSKVYYVGSFHSRYIVNDGDVLVGMDGDFSLCIWAGGTALLNQRVGRIRPKSCSKEFMYYALASPLIGIETETGATTVKHLSHADVESLTLSVPEMDEQCAIATALNDVDNEIAALDARFVKARSIKQGIMQQLLSGHTRLHVQDVSV